MRKIRPSVLAAIAVLLATLPFAFAAFRFDQLETKTVDFLGEGAQPLSAAGNGRMYFDNVSNHFFCSENGGAFRLCGAVVAGSDKQVQYNLAGNFGADSHLVWDYNTFTLSLSPGSGLNGQITLGGAVLASLGTPPDGTYTYCANCLKGSNPCSVGGLGGSDAVRLNSQWTCGGSGAVSGTLNHFARFTGGGLSLGDSAATDDGTTILLGARNLSYSQALFQTGYVNMSTNLSGTSTDRTIRCTSGSSTDKTYTPVAATGSGMVIDIRKIDSGTKACKFVVPSGALNSGTTVTLGSQWMRETCQDDAAGVWFCTGSGTVS